MQVDVRESQEAQIDWAHLRVPPFPEVALKVLQLATDENVQLGRLEDLISSDAAFATEVLTIVNSMLYSPRYPIRSILHAVEVLGAAHLRGLCLAVGVRAYLGKWRGHPGMRTLWRHNMAAALIAQQIASAGSTDHNIAYTAGILHGIGLLALAVVRPRECIELFGTFIGTREKLLDRERAVFGTNHCELGKKLVADWNLPEEFVAVMSAPHVRPAPGQWGVPEIVGLSCRMADSVGFSAFSACHASPFEELLEELPARERKVFHTEVQTLSFEVSKRIARLEST